MSSMTALEMSKLLDNSTLELPSSKKLNIVGDVNSMFLASLKKKALKLGFEVTENDLESKYPTVVDVETVENFNATRLDFWVDVDRLHNRGKSAVAEGILMYLKSQTTLLGKHVAIIGRGHAVKGLSDGLLTENATITICHSKTKSVTDICKNCDIVVNASPYDTSELNCDILVDITKNIPKGIGSLTTSILLNRAALISTAPEVFQNSLKQNK